MEEEEIINLEQDLTGQSTRSVISRLLFAAQQAKLPAAVWRLPDQQVIHLITGFNIINPDQSFELELSRPGFLLGGFESQFPDGNAFLPADIYFNSDSGLQINQQAAAGSRSSFQEWKKMVDQEISTLSFEQLPVKQYQSTSREHYLNVAWQGMDQIRRGNLKKVVPARLEVADHPKDLDAMAVFERLFQAYPEAFVSMVVLPGEGIWMGASPEMLIRIDENDHFYTTALAGTQLHNPEIPLIKAPWTQKEIEEQALVSRYIIDCFKKIRLREFDEVGPRTTRAGNLLHLRTDFKVDMQSTNFPQLGTVMLKLLHPTSAVSGMPKQFSHDFLIETEKFDREFFAGYLGPVNVGNATDIYVNIRCMQITRFNMLFYAGAGITAYSDPEQEWHETGHKIAVIKSKISAI